MTKNHRRLCLLHLQLKHFNLQYRALFSDWTQPKPSVLTLAISARVSNLGISRKSPTDTRNHVFSLHWMLNLTCMVLNRITASIRQDLQDAVCYRLVITDMTRKVIGNKVSGNFGRIIICQPEYAHTSHPGY